MTCTFVGYGVTYPFRRVSSPADLWFNKGWEEAKRGIGADASTIADLTNFFIGLDRLHEIVSQAEYHNHVLSMYNGGSAYASAHYKNFTVGPESSGYELSYSAFYWEYNPADDGLNVSAGPVVFSTIDHDPRGCAARRGAAGWYGSDDCQGYSMFADPLLWPVHGVDQQVQLTVFNLQRQSDFYHH